MRGAPAIGVAAAMGVALGVVMADPADLDVAAGELLAPESSLVRRFIAGHRFNLTGAQRRVLGEVASDMAGPLPMHRLLQGDVGSGKTVVALAAIDLAESRTAHCCRLHFRLAIDYSARAAILEAAGDERLRSSFFNDALPVDLLIRTGGEQRLSDFLLWESAYAELIFTKRMWPDFTPADLRGAVAEYRHRDRRFGAVNEFVNAGQSAPEFAGGERWLR